MALGSAAEPPWPSKVLLKTTSKPPVQSKVLPRRAPEPPNHAKAGPEPPSRREKTLDPASWPLCDRTCNSTSVFFAFAFVLFFVSVVDVACVSFVFVFVFVSVRMCVVGVRVCFAVSFRCRVYFCLRFSLMSVEATFEKYCSKVSHEIAARNYYSKSQVYVALGSVTPHSALPCYVHGYARVHTSIYIYIYIYIYTYIYIYIYTTYMYA